MADKKDRNAEERILEAAKQIIYRDGLQGARMQDIADLAQINRAMLHYYFRNKESLSEKVMSDTVVKFLTVFHDVLNADLPLEEKIDQYIRMEIEFAEQNSGMTIFALHEAMKDNDFFARLFVGTHSKEDQFPHEVYHAQIQKAIQEGKMVPFKDPHELSLIITSICFFPFIGAPIFRMIFNMEEEQWEGFKVRLKQILPKVIKQAIFINYKP